MRKPAVWKINSPISHGDYRALRDYPLLLSQLLYNRNIRTATAAEDFILPEHASFEDPLLMPDMPQAIARIKKAIADREKIAIYGDYDADGITATAILVSTITAFGGKVEPYIPHRDSEGYGVNKDAMTVLRNNGVGLVITVDCGTTAFQEISYARDIGLDVIVTDHHALTGELPPASAIINLRREDHSYPFTDLCGAGVAFKLAQGLIEAAGKGPPITEDDLIDLAAIGTVADMVPLLGENRRIVKRGLERMNDRPRLGLRALLDEANISPGSLDAGSIGFVIAPRLNAMGRLDHAIHSFKLLTTASMAEAQHLAHMLQEFNQERQNITRQVLERASAQAKANYDESAPIIIAAGEDFNAGVVGLVATRLVEEWYRPAIVLEQGEEESRGSCRSIPEVNIVGVLKQCEDLFERFGGHAQAAGFTIKTNRLPELSRRLTDILSAQLENIRLEPSLRIDAPLPLTAIPGDVFQQIERLNPVGQGNPQPLFMASRLSLAELRTFGKNSSHLNLKLLDNGSVWSAVAFGMGDRAAELKGLMSARTPIDIAYRLEIDAWTGSGKLPAAEGAQPLLRLNVRDLRPFSFNRA
ncbi:MAG: single-stranded-DNA-specific exonuclease RecJ [Dehalococcoidia bacterium]|nr:single-stranded-DNA-specific exonuclease RecJ [Dehalococcoidia bacterium]